MEEKHPREFFLLTAAAIFSRCTYYGVSNLFVLFLLDTYPDFSHEKVTMLFGIFASIFYFFPFIGGYLVDRWDYFHPLFLAPIITIAGYGLLLVHNEFALYVTMVLIAVGCALFTSTSVPLISHIYRTRPALRERGFLWFYTAFNLGTFFAGILFGSLATWISWNAAWISGIVLATFGLVPSYLFYKRYHHTYAKLHPHQMEKQEIAFPTIPKKMLRDRVIFLLLLNTASFFFWMLYSQGWSALSIYMSERMVGPIPIAWVLFSGGLFLFVIAPVFNWLHKRRHGPLSLSLATARGLLFMGLAFALMTLSTAGNGTISALYPALFFLTISSGELWIGPVGLSLTTQLAPPRFTSLFVGIWYAFSSLAYYSGGMLADLIDRIGPLPYFVLCVAIAWIPALFVRLFAKRLDKLQHLQ